MAILSEKVSGSVMVHVVSLYVDYVHRMCNIQTVRVFDISGEEVTTKFKDISLVGEEFESFWDSYLTEEDLELALSSWINKNLGSATPDASYLSPPEERAEDPLIAVAGEDPIVSKTEL